MGRRCLARDGESPGEPARHFFRAAAGGVRVWLFARRARVFCRVPALGMAPALFYRWPAGAACALCPRWCEGIGGLGALAARDVEPARPRNHFELEALSVPRRADDDDELRIARH